VSVEHQKYLSEHFCAPAGSECIQGNAIFAWDQHGKYFPLDKDACIWEIDPGFAAMLNLLHTKCGYTNVNAVDISPEVVDFCSQLMPQSTKWTDGTARFPEAQRGKHDLIIIMMFDVLEHVPKEEVVPFLMATRETLKLKGKILAEVPNCAHPLTGRYHRYHDITHTVGFSDQSLAFVMCTAGFSSVSIYPRKVPRISTATVSQRASQNAAELLVSMLLKLYVRRQPVILSSAHGACADK